MEFRSESQAGQDEYVYRVLAKSNGTFFDIGSQNPVEINNSHALELIGWTGFLFDVNLDVADETRKTRSSPFVHADMVAFDWDSFLEANTLVNTRIDYLSLDIDEASLPALRKIPFDKVSFNVCTIEHDRYRFGPNVAQEMRDIMQRNGYHMICKDVMYDGNPFEDWYVHPDVQATSNLVPHESIEWSEILKNIRSSSQ